MTPYVRIACLIFAQTAMAQEFEITRSSLTCGGSFGKSGGAFEAAGTIGVPYANEMTGGQFLVSGSLWTETRTPECSGDVPGYGECFEEDTTVKHWTGDLGLPDGREWGMCLNWYENKIPQDGDNACIPADNCQDFVIYREGDTILNALACNQGFVIDGSTGPTRLELNESSFILGDTEMAGNATLWVNDHLHVDGKLSWRNGIIDGQGLTEVNDGLSITNSSVEIRRGDFTLAGGEGFSNGPRIDLIYGATFTIGTQATYSYEGDSALIYGGSGLLDVRGSLIRSAGDAEASVQAPIDNSGLIHAQTGEFYLYNGGTHTGDVVGDPGTVLGFGGDHTFSMSSNLTATEIDCYSGNNSTVHGTVNISGTIKGTGATWTFADDANIIDFGDHLYVERGRINFDAPPDQPIDFETVTITSPGEGSGRVDFNTGQPVNVDTFTMVTGSLYGPSPVNISSTMSWTRGTFFNGGAITANGPVVFNATSSNRTLARTLNITDQANIHAGFGISGGTGRVNNLESAIFNMQFDGGGIGAGTFNNHGTILRSSGDGEISISAAMNNSGIIHNQSGTLSLSGGGTHASSLVADPGTVLKLGGRGHNFKSASTLTAETLDLFGYDGECHGTVDISDTLMCNGCDWTFANDASIIDYGDDLRLNSGSLRFEAPTDRAISFDTVEFGATAGGANIYFDTGQPVHINSLVMNNNATLWGASPINVVVSLTWNNGSLLSGGAVTNHGTATVNPTSSQRNLGRRFDNYGTMTFNGAIGVNSSVPINNMPGGMIELKYENQAITGGGVINNAGTLVKSGGDGEAGLLDVVNTGTIDVQAGSISFHTTYYEFTQTAGQTILNETAIVLTGSSPTLTFDGGLFTGNGSVLGSVANNAATMAPGLSAGQFTVEGEYTQGTEGTLEIEIGGTDPSAFDALTVTGTATLAGTLHVTDINDFAPAPGDVFVALTAAQVNGTFDTENLPAHYEVEYDATSVTVRYAEAGADLNDDGRIDLTDYGLFQACFAGSDTLPSGSCPKGIDADLDADGDVDLDDYSMLFTTAIQN